MSLISEALRKARQETAERDLRARGATVAPRQGEPRGRTRFGVGLLLGGFIACGAGLVGGGAVWWVLARGQGPGAELPRAELSAADEQAGAEASAAGLESSEDTTSDSEVIASSKQPPANGSAELGDLVENRAERPAVVDAETEPAPSERVDGSAGTVDTEAASGSSSATPPEAILSDGSRVYAIEAELGYASLSLGYIVFRETDSFAEINGQDVRVGSLIEGFSVEEIGRDQVSLRDDRGPLILRAR